jgi:hypothetical protein
MSTTNQQKLKQAFKKINTYIQKEKWSHKTLLKYLYLYIDIINIETNKHIKYKEITKLFSIIEGDDVELFNYKPMKKLMKFYAKYLLNEEIIPQYPDIEENTGNIFLMESDKYIFLLEIDDKNITDMKQFKTWINKNFITFTFKENKKTYYFCLYNYYQKTLIDYMNKFTKKVYTYLINDKEYQKTNVTSVSKEIPVINSVKNSTNLYFPISSNDGLNINVLNNIIDKALEPLSYNTEFYNYIKDINIEIKIPLIYDEEYYYIATAWKRQFKIELLQYPTNTTSLNKNYIETMIRVMIHEFGHFYYWKYSKVVIKPAIFFTYFKNNYEKLNKKYGELVYYFQYSPFRKVHFKNKVSEYFCEMFALYHMNELDKDDKKEFEKFLM